MRLTRAERKAATAVIGAAAVVTVAGIKVLRRYAKYMTRKAAAFFQEEDPAGKQEKDIRSGDHE